MTALAIMTANKVSIMTAKRYDGFSHIILLIITVFATILCSSAWAKNIAVEKNVLNDNSDIYFFCGKDTVGIEFTFANGEITTGEDTTFYEFDVMAAASEVGTKIGTGIALINYNTAGFGASIYTNGKVTVTKGTLTTTQGPPLYILIVNDNQTYRLAITFEYTSVSGWGNDLPDTATQLVHVKIEIADNTETAGLSFAESLMSEQQYYDDNATKYNPVIATDIDNTPLEPQGMDEKIGIPTNYKLYQNYPNPFNFNTRIMFNLPKVNHVRLSVYNIKGQLIDVLVDGDMNAGYHNTYWSGNKLSTGIYLYRIETENYTEIKKMMLIR